MATLTSLQSTLAKYEAARDAILTGPGQSYTIADRTFTKIDLAFIESQIEKLENKIAMATNSGRLTYGTAVFGTGGRR